MAKFGVSAAGTPKSDELLTSLSVVYTPSSWQQALAAAQWSPAALAERLSLPNTFIDEMTAGTKQFPIRATESYLQRIEIGNTEDPLLLQVLPSHQEMELREEYSKDPVGDHAAQRPGGLLQKYHGRALLITTPACAIHCRYCFRRHYPYEHHHFQFNQQEAIEWLQSDHSIHEVILSGGDPLMLNDQRLQVLLNALDAIPHIQTIRFHTRLPVVLPSRITESLLEILQPLSSQLVVVTHSNHSNELNREVAESIHKLKTIGITLLNQSVLLKRINNDAETLKTLSHRLFEIGVLPYYLHLLDKVEGSHHFNVEEPEALQLMKTLRSQLPGYLVPRLVREIEGEPNKSPIG